MCPFPSNLPEWEAELLAAEAAQTELYRKYQEAKRAWQEAHERWSTLDTLIHTLRGLADGNTLPEVPL